MKQENDKPSFFVRLATIIVDKRNLIFFLYACALIFCLFSRSWVGVCNDITQYLPETTETRRGLTLMEEEFTTLATARVMVSHVTYDAASNLAGRIADIDGVSSADFGSADTPEDIAEHFKGADALIDVTFSGEAQDELCLTALGEIRELLEPYDFYIDSDVGSSQADSLAGEMQVILAVAALIIVLVLLFTSRSYAEVPVLLVTFIAAALLNLGTNFIFGEISFVSNSVTVVLQLALAIDYAIIMLHRFMEERETKPEREACIAAVAAAIPSISASSLTTISGLAAMMFMQFRIGFDMGIVLIKAILFSMLSVFTLMPGLLMLSSRAMEKTRHRSFIPAIGAWGRLSLRLRHAGVLLFAIALAGGLFLSQQCPYVYGYSQIHTASRNDDQIAEQKINEVFGAVNQMALIVPRGDYASEKALLARLETYDEVDYALGLSNVEVADGYCLTSSLTPRQFSEMTDLDYELVQLLYAAYVAETGEYGHIIGGLDDYSVPLMYMFFFAYDKAAEGYVTLDSAQQTDLDSLYAQLSDARMQLLGDSCTRMLLSLNLPEEGEETFDFLQTIHSEAARYYDPDDILLGDSCTRDYDLSVSFARDNIIISVLSVLFVVLVLLFTFQSVGMPILLILVIQGSIWLNFSISGLTGEPIFFMSHLIVTSIQMGANIDYAIVISSWYSELKAAMPRRDAIIQALNLAFPTVFTSGSILSSAGFLIARITTDPAIAGIGACLCRGTLISMFLVMFVLPQILYLGDSVVERTRFNIKVPEMSRIQSGGTVYINGRIRGRISGVVDANIRGIIRGDVSGIVETGSYQQQEVTLDGETEHQ